MSAYIVSRNHVDYLIKFGLAQKQGTDDEELRFLTEESATHVGQMLFDDCVKSVQYRYDHVSRDQLPCKEGPPWIYAFDRASLYVFDPCQVDVSLNCFDYQACEHPGWTKSESRAFIEMLDRKAQPLRPEPCRGGLTNWHPCEHNEQLLWGAPEPLKRRANTKRRTTYTKRMVA